MARGHSARYGEDTLHIDNPATGGAEAVRRIVVRWFALLAVPWIVLVVGMAVVFGTNVPQAIVVSVFGALVVAVLGLRGLQQVLEAVDRLDDERHGLREAYDRARLDSLRDGLTGLGNHRAFQEELDHQVTGARESGGRFALLYVDVDDLKKTNDGRGHASGDDLLRATARILESNMRRPDRGYRIGGDEFAVLLADCGADEGLAIGRRILASALDGGAGTQGVPPFSVTIGVSAYPEPAADRRQLIRQADAALYWGKRHGRTEVQVYDPARHGMADDIRPLEELAAAVSRVAVERLLRPVYQPLYDLRTGRVLGYEGLVRVAPGGGFDGPSSLFVAAEATGRTVELDLAALEAVMVGARLLDETQYLSVNLSPRTLETESFNPFEILQLARRAGFDPTRLVVELTEREAVEDLGRLRDALGALRRHGVRIAADDVGAGNAGLRLLSEVTFDIIKVDLSLVRAGTAHESAESVLRALRDLAGRQGQRILAEGVETVDQLAAIMGLGFDSAQGYLLGRPAPGLDAAPIDLRELCGPDRTFARDVALVPGI
jgi:diguanylate cyclase (GGDEF)-like protein